MAVTGEHFVDREEEIREIASSALSGQHIVLYAPRKMGKSSLIEEMFCRLKNEKQVAAFRISLERVETKEALARLIINKTIENSYTSVEKLLNDAKDLFKRIRIRAFADMDGRIGIEPFFSEADSILEDALELPEKVASKKGTRIIIALDEFQRIDMLGGPSLERLFRSIIETQKNVSYIFTGSEKHLISLMFEDKQRPFYRFAKQMELKTIKRGILEQFIVSRIEATGKKIDGDAVKYIIDFSEGIPFYVQCFCHESWYNSGARISLEIVRNTQEEKIIPSASAGYFAVWNGINGSIQRKLLIGMAKDNEDIKSGGKKIYSKEFIAEHGLVSTASARKAMKALESADLVYKNCISDFFFREWLKNQILE
jgi:AAA+ ATPase superfamily predicted ATPase